MSNVVCFIKGATLLLLMSFSLIPNFITPTFSSEAIDYGPDPLGGVRPEAGYTKVRIWKTNLAERRAGHVSLETDESYISVWPNSNDRTATKTEEIGDGFTPVIHAPALNAESYMVDFSLEESLAPDYVYVIKANSQNINGNWRVIRDNYAEPAGSRFVKLNGVIWLAPSGSLFPAPIEGAVHVNCAAAALLALGVGGIDVSDFVSRKKSSSGLTRNTAELLSTTPKEAQELLQMVGLWSFYDSIIKPDDIAQLLDDVIRQRDKHVLSKCIENGTLNLIGVEETKRSIAINEILKRLPKRTDENGKMGLDTLGTLRKNAMGASILTLKADIIEEINRLYDIEMAVISGGLGALGGGVIGGMIGGEKGAAIGAVLGGGGGGVAASKCIVM